MISDSCYQPEPKYTELPCYKAGYKRRRALADCSMIWGRLCYMLNDFSQFRFFFRTGERLQNLRRNNRMQNVLWYA